MRYARDVRDQFLHVETEAETQCIQSQFFILRPRLLKLVSNFETETETLYICLKSWDWYWDFCPGYQKLRLRLRPWSVSNIETDTDTFDFKNKKITLYDPKHTFYVTKKLLKCWHEINFSEGSKICDEQDLQ